VNGVDLTTPPAYLLDDALANNRLLALSPNWQVDRSLFIRSARKCGCQCQRASTGCTFETGTVL
jgi:hypothetical protein